ncbi:helix-turn-helix domain-containing protein [Hyphomonas johnsonii]|uniref:DnaA domain-containing protein n=1 Tax=Hyphomonas johnsonii MHS-2 TaxID=1280950 RepID=A0A059FTF6_9PROT|nr:helix-turn-helix domain-containing protein [Hyphomonas johnsonii]KCZ93738.1 DnaA domain-containing protein [Hyphomonas johnsonii MHS-2]
MAKFDPRKDEDRAYLAAALTAYALGLRLDVILSHERGRPIESRARHIAMYLTHVALGMSLARIARAFDRDRSTVAYACHLIEDRRDDGDFDDWIEQLSVGLSSVVLLSEAPAVA